LHNFRSLNVIKFLRNTWWGSDISLLLNIYKSIIRSKIEYCSFIWYNVPKYLWNIIQSIQVQALRNFFITMWKVIFLRIHPYIIKLCFEKSFSRINYKPLCNTLFVSVRFFNFPLHSHIPTLLFLVLSHLNFTRNLN